MNFSPHLTLCAFALGLGACSATPPPLEAPTLVFDNYPQQGFRMLPAPTTTFGIGTIFTFDDNGTMQFLTQLPLGAEHGIRDMPLAIGDVSVDSSAGFSAGATVKLLGLSTSVAAAGGRSAAVAFRLHLDGTTRDDLDRLKVAQLLSETINKINAAANLLRADQELYIIIASIKSTAIDLTFTSDTLTRIGGEAAVHDVVNAGGSREIVNGQDVKLRRNMTPAHSVFVYPLVMVPSTVSITGGTTFELRNLPPTKTLALVGD